MTDQKQFWNEAHKNSIIAAHSTKQTSFAEDSSKVLAPHSKILELGCGEGNDSIYFAEQGHEVVATDVAGAIIKQNSKRYDHPKLRFVQQDISQPFAFPDASFDAVYARLSLHYFTDAVTRKVFTEIARVLKPGGKLCFMCKSTEDRLYGRGTQIEPDTFESDHIRHFFSEEYAKDLLKQNFILEMIRSGKEEIYGKTSGFVKVVAAKN
jgi:ubiquinone/menaquinone biosynthesis C-methylase UbiE